MRQIPKSIQTLSGLIAHLSLSIGAMLIAIQARLQLLPFGSSLGPGYQAQHWRLFAFPVIMITATYMIIKSVERVTETHELKPHQMNLWIASSGNILSFFILLATSNEKYYLQLVYFLIAALLLILLTIHLPFKFRPHQSVDLIRNELAGLWNTRHLLNLWLRFNIQARYTQTILGVLWIVLLPLATSIVVAIAFTNIMRFNTFGGDIPVVAYIMSGLVPFSLFQSGIIQSTQAVTGNMSVINKVYFPREILVLVRLGEALVDFVFAFLALLVLEIIVGIVPTINTLLVFLPIVLLFIMLIAVGFFVSVWSAFVRDIPQLVSVIMQLLFYLTPIIYPFNIVPENLRFLVLLNPVTPIVQSFRDLVVVGILPDPISLYYPLVISIALLVPGYAYFKSKQGTLSDMV